MEKKLTGTALGAAAIVCLAGCAALAILPLVGVGAAGGLIGMVSGEWLLGLAVLAAAGGWLVLRRLRSDPAPVRTKAPATSGCGCSPDSGCNTGDACDIPQETSRMTIKDRLKSIC